MITATAVGDLVRITAGFCTDRIGTVVNVHPSGSADVRVVHPMWFCDPSSPLTTSVLCYAPAEFVPAHLPGGEDYLPTPPPMSPGGADERPALRRRRTKATPDWVPTLWSGAR